MSHLNLDGDSLARLLARAGVDTAVVDSSGATVTAPGWEARVERVQVEATVRVGGLALRVTGVEFTDEGVGVRFTIG